MFQLFPYRLLRQHEAEPPVSAKPKLQEGNNVKSAGDFDARLAAVQSDSSEIANRSIEQQKKRPSQLQAISLNQLARKNMGFFRAMLKNLAAKGFDVKAWKKADGPIDLKEHGYPLKTLSPFHAKNLNSFARKGQLKLGLMLYEKQGYDTSAWEGAEGPIDLNEAGLQGGKVPEERARELDALQEQVANGEESPLKLSMALRNLHEYDTSKWDNFLKDR